MSQYLGLIENMQIFRLSWRAAEEIAWADLGRFKRRQGNITADNDKAGFYTGAEDNVMRITAGMCYIAFHAMGTKRCAIRLGNLCKDSHRNFH